MTTSTVIGVLGASGGVGASSLAAALASRAAAAGLPAVCVDGVRHGGGLDVTCGLEQEPGLRWPDLAGVRGVVDGQELCGRLPGGTDVPVLSFDRHRDVRLTDEPVQRVLEALGTVCRPVVIDLPAPDSTLFGLLAGHCDHLVLVCGSRVRELAAASTAAPVGSVLCPQTWVCLRAGAGAGDLAELVETCLDLPVLTVLQDDPRVAADLVHGVLPGSGGKGPLVRSADKLLATLLTQTAPEGELIP